MLATSAYVAGVSPAAEAESAPHGMPAWRVGVAAPFLAQAPTPAAATRSPEQVLLARYCVSCHNDRTRTAGLALDSLDITNVSADAPTWEKVVRKLRAGVMPPLGRPRPDEATYDQFVAWLEGQLDSAAAARPDPGRTETFHRLNRVEYRNAIRDLLAIDVNVEDLLPADDSSYGFDNIAGVLRMSPSLMERYLSAAKTISRLAVGTPLPAIDHETYRVPPETQQHYHVPGLPFGTRGGTLVTHLFPLSGEYDIELQVAGTRVRERHEIYVLVDGVQVRQFTLGGDRSAQDPTYQFDEDLKVRVKVEAGPREIGVAFSRRPMAPIEQVRRPFENPTISGNDGGPLGSMPSLSGLTVAGPFAAEGAGDTPSRRKIFVCAPAAAAEESGCARTILAGLAKRAYRGFVTDQAVNELVRFYEDSRAGGGSFEEGIELGLRRLLMSPEFLFRVEVPPQTAARVQTVAATEAPGVYRISDLELASRLSFFLWSSIPDDELLAAAEAGRLQQPAELDRQVRRMLADPRSSALTENFAGQWLQLRNMATVRPGDPFSLTFDETLRDSMWRETELFFDSILREDRSVMDMLTADYTFLNERLAIHYDVPGVRGSHFRRVTLPAESPRRGILGHGSILTMTSHAIRTSPVFRGKWVLNNILGTPPPEPPPNIPALNDRKTQAKVGTMRERMAQHASNPSCSACHSLIDPAGFALENFDAIGRWRTTDESFNPIDATGSLPDGTSFNGVQELREGLVRRPERFVTTVTEKLMTYALGRGVEYYDMPSIRRIVEGAKADGYKFQSIILGVAKSYPFLNRKVAATPAAAVVAAH